MTRPPVEIEYDVDRVAQQIERMVEKVLKAKPLGMALKTVEVRLAFSAKGGLMFNAEAGVEASIHLSYTPAHFTSPRVGEPGSEPGAFDLAAQLGLEQHRGSARRG